MNRLNQMPHAEAREPSDAFPTADNLIHNDDGRMGCFDLWGNKSLRGPLPKLSPFPTLRPQEFVS